MENAPKVLDIIDRARSARVLRALLRRGVLNQREITEISRHSPEQAKELRDDLESAGIIKVKDLSGHGNAGIKESRLTPFGTEVAKHEVAIEDLVQARFGKDGDKR